MEIEIDNNTNEVVFYNNTNEVVFYNNTNEVVFYISHGNTFFQKRNEKHEKRYSLNAFNEKDILEVLFYFDGIFYDDVGDKIYEPFIDRHYIYCIKISETMMSISNEVHLFDMGSQFPDIRICVNYYILNDNNWTYISYQDFYGGVRIGD